MPRAKWWSHSPGTLLPATPATRVEDAGLTIGFAFPDTQDAVTGDAGMTISLFDEKD